MLQYRLLYIVSCVLCLGVIYKYKRIGLWIVLGSFVLFPFIINTNGWDWFDYLKRYTVLVCGIWLLAGSYFNSSKREVTKRLAYFIRRYSPFLLSLNILEMVLRELLQPKEAFLNALVGLILAVTLEFNMKNWYYNKENTLGFRANRTNILWVLLFTFWDINFVYFSPNITVIFYKAIVILPLVLWLCLVTSWHNWLFFRAFSLYFAIYWGAVCEKGPIYIDAFSPSNRIVDFLHYPASITLLPFAFLLVYFRAKEYGLVDRLLTFLKK